MASVFTFDPDPPRVSSPWSDAVRLSAPPTVAQGPASVPRRDEDSSIASPVLPSASPSDVPLEHVHATTTHLPPEPQSGPIEYKLHLLLRPRRSFQSLSTGRHVSGSKSGALRPSQMREEEEDFVVKSGSLSPRSRQNRFEQLTTQLLWRLQQSSPYHASAKREATPNLEDAMSEPEEAANGKQSGTSALKLHSFPGLTESHGALYELGVSDDGSLVGLASDEIDESLSNLGRMAAGLGCEVEVLRMVAVGQCEWVDHEDGPDATKLHPDPEIMTDQLWVAEALVKPLLEGPKHDATESSLAHAQVSNAAQLRVSLAGATTSGKSSLLGTLSTSTLDNGRGKSRLSLLKHRHELASGLTSSVAPELIGYTSRTPSSSEVINYAHEGVASWIDVHNLATGRLIFFSDSAGHPRYRRTAVRGLMGWAPHWTILCVAADTHGSTELSNGEAPDNDGNMFHLSLCLKLDLPLVVTVTKLDLATRDNLRSTLSSILSVLKTAGRQPVVLTSMSQSQEGIDVQSITVEAEDKVRPALEAIASGEPKKVVPIVLASAVTGTGVLSLHALLNGLPIPAPTAPPGNGCFDTTLFHVEEVYHLPICEPSAAHKDDQTSSVVIAGHLSYGEIELGSTFRIGPFHSDEAGIPSLPSHGLKELFSDSEWRLVKIVSIRNLRAPVRTLLAGQVGTLGISFTGHAKPPLRRGLVLGNLGEIPLSQAGFIIKFRVGEGVSLSRGSFVVLHVASIRATARVDSISQESKRITFEFTTGREWVRVGTSVLVMTGSGRGSFGATTAGNGNNSTGAQGEVFASEVIDVIY